LGGEVLDVRQRFNDQFLDRAGCVEDEARLERGG
jgi:hypothetical protein